MLLVTRHSAARRAQQKPRQWGPNRAVRSAVWENAAELGVDPASIAAIWPTWGDRYAVIGPHFTAYGNPVFDRLGIEFDGVDDYVTFDPVTDILGADIAPSTFSFLYTPRDLFRGCVISGHDSAGNNQFFLFQTYATSICLDFYNGSTWGNVQPITNDKQYHIVITNDGTYFNIYVDGMHKVQATSGSVSSCAKLSFGQEWDGASPSDFAHMNIDAPIVLQRVISQSAREALYRRPYALLQPRPRRLVFDLGAGGTVYTVTAVDGLAAGDTPGGSAIFEVGCSDGLAAGDGDSGLGVYPLTVADGVTLTDASGYTVGVEVVVSDGLLLGDTPTGAGVYTRTAADGVALGEALAAVVVWEALAADGLLGGDTAIGTILGTVVEALVADGLIAADAADQVAALTAQLADGVTLTETSSVRTTWAVTVEDGVQLGEVLAAFAAFGATVADGVALADSPRIVLTTEGAVLTLTARRRTWRIEARVRTWALKARSH